VVLTVQHVGRDGTRYGVAEAILRPAPERVEARCPHFLACGGCDLLHLDLAAQRAFKRRRVAEALGLPLDRVAETVASPRSLGYRALAKLVVGPGGILGSYRPRTHDVEDMKGCVVHAPEAEAVVEAARAALAGRDPGDLRYVLVRASLAEGRAVVTLVTRGAPPPAPLVAALTPRADVARVVHHVHAGAGDALWGEGPSHVLMDRGPVVEVVGPVRQSLEAGAFVQINPGAAGRLYARAVADADPAGARVLDLYAGSGGVSLALLAAGAASVVAVESVPAAAAAALAAAAAQGVSDRLEVRAAPVEVALSAWSGPAPERVTVNPPRKGLGPGVVAALGALGVPRLVYVSCNPTSLARDVAGLSAAGYAVAAVTPVDLFPHTDHVETVAVLTRG
jgi:23S rRNA (uracil1939-C5)-methyltransferase